MKLPSARAAEVTRKKLTRLEEVIAGVRCNDEGNPKLQAMSIQSLRKLANQLREELARYDARAKGSLTATAE